MIEHLRIDEARRRFARSLVGNWSTAQGTFSVVAGQQWEIRPDGSGRFTEIGPFGHKKAETQFEWRQRGDFEIELRLTEYVSHESSDTADLDDQDREWQVIRYDFVAVQHDCGMEVGLVGGLLSLDGPLSYCSQVG